MKNSQAQVYIATTQGLVHVQSISTLNDPNLRSVVSINSSSELAGISPSYANFVLPPQGIIQAQFGGFAYRLNVSGDISQGNSWQLGVYIAHFLHACYTLRLQPNNQQTSASYINQPQSPQTIIVATGEIDTMSLNVASIEHLTKKCALANKAIQTWLAEGKKVLFLVPTANYREPVPDSSIQLTPISNLDQLPLLLDAIGLKRTHRLASKTSEIGRQQHQEPDDMPYAELLGAEQQQERYGYTRPEDNLNAVVIEASERSQGSLYKGLQDWLEKALKTSVLITLSIWILISVALYFAYYQGTDNTKLTLQNLDYQYAAIISENKASCRLANEMVQAKTSPNPHLANINGGNASGVSQFANFVQLPPTNLNDICQLTLLSSNMVQAVWLISDANFANVMTINPIVQPNGNREWSIPLSQISGSSQNIKHEYRLLVFMQAADAADLQSLKAFLKRVQDTGQAHSLADLSQWSSQLSMSVVFVEHSLLTQ